MRGAALALSLLTIVPVRTRAQPLSNAAIWFPVVGALVGLAAGGVRIGAEDLFDSAPVAATLAALTLVVLTGALHQDGLADCADAIGVRGGRERRLEVMRDSTIGAFGALALVFWALLVITTLAATARDDALATLVVACAGGRWAALIHARLAPPARADGLGALFAVSGPAALIATLAMAAVTVVTAAPLAPAAALGAALATSAWARHALGGRTGDTLGATVALAELAALLTLLA